ncbi:MAG: TlpA family protein disulfide reductase [Candidatus Bipolaricaulota bacterium]|nr:MAG: TlpA family protein disulfide reductase [Candidatus Bipolaricaulota bacterium]
MQEDTKRTPTSLRALAAVVGLAAAAAAISLPLVWGRIFPPREVPFDDTASRSLFVDDGPSSASDDVTGGTGFAVGDTAPGFALETIDGEPVALADYRGKVVILDFWASWCTPCRRSMPHVEDLAEQFATHGAVLLGICLDRSRAAAVSYLEHADHPLMIALWGSYARATRVARSYGVIGIPRTFVIDRDGIVRFAGHPLQLRADDVADCL